MIGIGRPPRVTVAMTVGPCQEWLDAAVRSVIRSTFRDWRLVVALDGCPLNSRIPLDDPRISLKFWEKAGRAHSLKRVLDEAQTDYICWVDADDELGPDALRAGVAALDARRDADLFVTGYAEIERSRDGGWIESRRRLPSPLVDGGQRSNIHFALIRKSAYDSVGGINTSFEWAMDLDLLLRVEERGGVISAMDCSHYKYRRHSRSWGSVGMGKQARFAGRAKYEALVRRDG